MEEQLFEIKIQKDRNNFFGETYSKVYGIKEFKEDKIESLLREITYDIRLSFSEFPNSTIGLIIDED